MSTISGTRLQHKTRPWHICGLKQHGSSPQGTRTCRRKCTKEDQKIFMLHYGHYQENPWLISHRTGAWDASKPLHFHPHTTNAAFTHSNDAHYRAKPHTFTVYLTEKLTSHLLCLVVKLSVIQENTHSTSVHAMSLHDVKAGMWYAINN